MKNEMFAELVKSVREGMAIMRGEKEPFRSFHLPIDKVESRNLHSKIKTGEPDPKKINQ